MEQVSQRTTMETCPATTVLLVGVPDAMVPMVVRACRTVPTAEVVSCDLKSASTRVAELWPFVIVLSEDLYAFDATEFDLLARDVSSQIVTISLEPGPSFESDLGQEILAAYRTCME